jgi:hypothetical protein
MQFAIKISRKVTVAQNIQGCILFVIAIAVTPIRAGALAVESSFALDTDNHRATTSNLLAVAS